VLAVVFFFSSAGVFGEHANLLAWYYDDLGIKYRAAFLFTFIACWHAALCSLGIPLIMYLYRTVRSHGCCNATFPLIVRVVLFRVPVLCRNGGGR
jgi:hypothetical protein